jgi:isopenicillin-N epimerase
MVSLLRDMAAFMNAQPDELAFMPNATTGFNTVLANVRLNPGTNVVMLDTGYGSLKKCAQSACAAAGVELIQVHVKLPVQCAAIYFVNVACLA